MPEAYHNYQRDLGYIIRWNQRKGIVPTLLMHACCGPCSTYCIEYLSQFFKITIFYYNPNIAPTEEYAHRVAEIRRFVNEFKTKYPVIRISIKLIIISADKNSTSKNPPLVLFR